MDDFEKELKLGFLEEASQLLTDAEQCFLALESNPQDGAMLDKIFRLAHNLKGSSKAVGFEDIGVFTHRFESFLLKVKNGEIAVSSSVISLLLVCNDHIRSMVDTLKGDLDARIDSAALMERIEAASQGGQDLEQSQEIPVSTAATEVQTEEEGFEAPTAEEIELLRLVNHSFDGVGVEASPVVEAAPVAKAPAANVNSPDDSNRVSLARHEK
jgi:two-component system chemotaxis sensor kinase CheA